MLQKEHRDFPCCGEWRSEQANLKGTGSPPSPVLPALSKGWYSLLALGP